jgi:hypothetical protein
MCVGPDYDDGLHHGVETSAWYFRGLLDIIPALLNCGCAVEGIPLRDLSFGW